ncbi:MAG TPA: hypothetical protein VGP96_16460 [Candidatus Dormibacteraeota bacterium]|nr:hypothetical protein [Candidatus Dormibacteraeota bacterium]
MIRAQGRSARGLATPGRRAAAPRVAVLEQAAAPDLSPAELACEVVRRLNLEDLHGFRELVAPTVRLTTAGGAETAALDAPELFRRLTTLAPHQTLCAGRIRATEGSARIDLEIAWPVAAGRYAASSLGTLELAVTGGRVTGLILDLDVDPSMERAVAALAAAPG